MNYLRQSPQFQSFMSMPPEKVVDDIQKGQALSTESASLLNYATDAAFLNSLVEAGLIDVLLEYVDRSLSESFAQVLLDVGGDVYSHHSWLVILVNLGLKEANSYQIAPRIGPLIKCLSKHTFFKKKQDFSAMGNCMELINNLLIYTQNIPVLLQHTSLIDFMVQSLFWTKYRPDLIQKLCAQQKRGKVNDKVLETIQSVAFRALCLFCTVDTESQEGKKRLERIGLAPVIDHRYVDFDEKNQIAFVTGLFELLKARDHDIDELLFLLFQLVAANCVDKQTILGIIELGPEIVSSPQDAAKVVRIICFALIGETKPFDDRFAFAVKEGVFQLVLEFIVRYGDDSQFIMATEKFFKVAVPTALEQKSFKAIQNCAPRIRAAAQGALPLTRNESRQFVQKVLEVLKVTSHTGSDEGIAVMTACRQCKKLLVVEEAKRCSRCKLATYCSKDCQRENWIKGEHKIECSKMKALHVIAEEQGASKKDVARALKNEKNASAIGSKLFFDNPSKVVMRAIAKKLSILDCVVVIDMCQAPPLLSPMPVADFINKYTKPNDHQEQVIKRNQADGSLSLAVVSAAAYNHSKSIMLKTVPAQATDTGSWQSYQKRLELRMRPMLEEFEGRPDDLEEQLEAFFN